MANNKTVKVQLYWIGAIALVISLFALAATVHADDGNKGGSTGIEVNISTNGNVLVRGAKVTNVSGSQINANTSLGSSVLSWVVKTDSETDFSANKNGADGLTNIAVGDTVSFRGSIDQAVSGLTVNARQVKDWTSVETKAKLEGVVTSINTTLGSFTIAKKNSTTTVQTSSSTKFTEDGDNASFADIVLDAKVKIAGFFNASTSVFTANSVEIDEESNKWNNDDKKEWHNWIKSKVWLKLWND